MSVTKNVLDGIENLVCWEYVGMQGSSHLYPQTFVVYNVY